MDFSPQDRRASGARTDRLSAKKEVDLPGARDSATRVCSGNSCRVRDRPNEAADAAQQRRLVVVRAPHDVKLTQLAVAIG